MQIRFCFEIEDFNCDTYSFVVNSPINISFIEMTGNSNLNDVGLFIASLLSFSELSLDSKFVKALFAKNELALVGGLLFKTNDVSIGSSCCADFQDWINVVKDVKHQISPWMGHDPSPWFEFKGEDVILWSDEGKSTYHNFITFTQQEFDRQLLEAKKELYYFLSIVEQWAIIHYRVNSERLVAGIKNYLLL
jgi:hypothetical protein